MDIVKALSLRESLTEKSSYKLSDIVDRRIAIAVSKDISFVLLKCSLRQIGITLLDNPCEKHKFDICLKIMEDNKGKYHMRYMAVTKAKFRSYKIIDYYDIDWEE